MVWNNPLAPARLRELLRQLALPEGAHLYDLGCGTGEVAALAVEEGLRVSGVDISEEAVRAARERVPAGRFVVGDARTSPWPAEVDVVCCLGSSHAFGAGEQALTGLCTALGAQLAPGVPALVGEGFQRQPLPEPYAALLGSPHGLERTHFENVAEVERHGFVCEHAITASEAEWDAFEWGFFRRRRKREWRDAYLRWGRATMGFGVYVLRRVQAEGFPTENFPL